MKMTRIRPETGLTRSPEEEPEAFLLGTIATGPWAVGTVVGAVIGGHRGRREATEIPTLKVQIPGITSDTSVGKGLMPEYNCTVHIAF